jgi:hypothetical protein
MSSFEGFMKNMPCKVEFGYQLSICSMTEGGHGKSCSSWSDAYCSQARKESKLNVNPCLISATEVSYTCMLSMNNDQIQVLNLRFYREDNKQCYRLACNAVISFCRTSTTFRKNILLLPSWSKYK